MNIIKSYKSSVILISSVLIGGVLGLVMGDKASIIAPLGDIFLNLIFTILIPMVFFSISSAIANISANTKVSRVIIVTLMVFISTAVVSGIIGILGFSIFNPTRNVNPDMVMNVLGETSNVTGENIGILERIVSCITVKDFSQILSRNNLLALVIFSVIVGVGVLKAGEEGKPISRFLSSGAVVCNKVIEIIMYYAPIGLGAYFANVVGALGTQILNGYFKVFILYVFIACIYYFGFFTLYAYIAGKKDGIKSFWKNAGGPSVTAIATCSSAACIPINIEAAKKMGVPNKLADVIMPIGVNLHKDGSVIGGIFKIMFLFGVFGRSTTGISSFITILLVGLFIGVLVGAIPIGGSIGEILILSIFGFPPEALAIMLVIATIIDAPATLLNSAGNTVCTMIISKYSHRLK